MAGSNLRTIVESPEFVEQRERIQPIVRLWDRFWFGIDWTLSRKPEAGFRILNVWLMLTEPSPLGMTRLRILYTFDDDVVTMLWIERAP